MNYNIKRHKLLQLLAPTSVEMQSENLGISFDDINKKLKINHSDYTKIASRLHNEKEIQYTNVEFEGVFSTSKGLESFTDKKYLRESNKIILSKIRNIVQIIIPILSLTVAVTVLFLKLDYISLKLKKSIDKEYKTEIEYLKSQIDSIKTVEKDKIIKKHE